MDRLARVPNWLARAWRRRGERGGVTAVFASVLGCGVLLGMGTLVVDVARLYVEREQLQSGADAGALKIAQVCATTSAICTSRVADVARQYADANSADGTAGVSVVCGRGGDLAPCPAPSGGLADCVRAAPAAGDYVEIRTDTRLPDGSTVLPPVFAQSIVDGYRGATVNACARAAWGAPRSARLALAISVCEWDRYTTGGASYPDPPTERLIHLHDDPTAGVCQPAGSAGAGTPGGFGWLDDPAGGCRTPVVANGTYQGQPADTMSHACEAMLTEGRRSRRAVLMPIYNAVAAQGGTVRYTLLGFAGFVVTGWDLPGSRNVSTLTGRSSCDTPTPCVYGYFTRATVPGGGPIGGPDLGASVVGLVG
jgi:hypothetical protein